MNRSGSLPRRDFVASGAAAAATALVSSRAVTANEKVNVGFIGYGLIGKRHVLDFRDQPDVNIVAVAECHEGRLNEAKSLIGGRVQGLRDFRKLLDDKSIDAVVVSTPDHWHGLMTMLACAAGKDVYVEKPLTLFPREGQWMMRVAERHKRVVQVGTQQRSGPHYHKARELIQNGHIGKIVSVRMQSFRNIMPGFGTAAVSPPPPEFDWDMFQGPAPARAFNPHRGLYHFRWFWDYSGGQMTNLGQHSLDIVDWFLGPLSVKSVTSLGGRFALTGDGETPDTQDAIFQFPDFTAIWSLRETSQGEPNNSSSFVFHGTKGSLAISRSGFTVTSDRAIRPEDAVPQFTTDGQPVGGVARTRENGPAKMWTTPVSDQSGNQLLQFQLHVRNFLDCIKTRQQPVSDLASGHRVSTWCHLANISLRLGRSLSWDFEQDSVRGDDEATKMLERAYRSPWDADLKSVLAEMKDGESVPGLFVVGTDTGVGKTYVAARISAALCRDGKRVGVYKPAASGCRRIAGELVSDDALALWEAAGQPGTLEAVCPQRFAAPLAPHLAAREEGKELDSALLRQGLQAWQQLCEIIIVEGAGGLLSPLGDHEYVADLAAEIGFPLLVVVPNRIGAINSALLTLLAAATRSKSLVVAGIVLNDVLRSDADPSIHSNRRQLEFHCDVPVLAQLGHGATDFDTPVDWMALTWRTSIVAQRRDKVR